MLLRVLGGLLLAVFLGSMFSRARFHDKFSPARVRHLLSWAGFALCGLALLVLSGPVRVGLAAGALALWVVGTAWQLGVMSRKQPR